MEIIHFLCCRPFQAGLQPLLGHNLYLRGRDGYYSGVEIDHLNFGKAVALVNLVDCKRTDDLTVGEIEPEKHFGNFSPGRFAWKLEMVDNSFEPFPVKGGQRIFEVDLKRSGPVIEADADCSACRFLKDDCDGEAFRPGCKEFRTADDVLRFNPEHKLMLLGCSKPIPVKDDRRFWARIERINFTLFSWR